VRAELVLMGKRIDMARRAHRRTLVVLIYAAMATLMACLWPVDHWRTAGTYMIFATLFVNRFCLGGYNFGGLIKPFNGKAPRQSDAPPSFLLLALHVYQPAPEDREYRNDERELVQRGNAHYKAYQAVMVVLCLLWFVVTFSRNNPRAMAWIHVPTEQLLYVLVLGTIVAGLTLPQAILLWTEPDMEEEA
jgi:hypothetical protein